MKTCRKCSASKAIEQFELLRSGYRRGSCRSCESRARVARANANPERQRAAEAASRGRRREAEASRAREFRATEEGRAYKAEYRQRNRDRLNAQAAARRTRNIEAARAAARDHARKRRLGPELMEWACVLIADPCAYCAGESTGVDHVEALARGGANDADNLTGACFDCNRRKRERPLLVFLATR